MPQSSTLNRRILLNARPEGAPVPSDFRQDETEIPVPEEGQILLRTEYLSLDPYMRGRMSEAASYADPLNIGDVMLGGTVCQVMQSHHPKYKTGDRVLGFSGWQDYALSDGKGLLKLDQEMANPSWALGILGMPGFTAYMGLLDIGQPQAGETLVVAAASGAVGSVVGQIAKIKGCRVVGVAGGKEKCQIAVEEFGFDTCIDHRSDNFATELAEACPSGIDIYYENVGGKVLEAVLPLLNTKARIPVCGLIAHYNDTSLPSGPNLLALLTRAILVKRLKVQGFIIFDDYGHRYPEFAAQMGEWVRDHKIRTREDIVEGLENAPGAFIGLLEGKNTGKLIIKVA